MGAACAVFVSGDYVFVLTDSSLAVIDISDPLHPDGIAEVVGTDPEILDMWNNESFYISGDYAYVVSRFNDSLNVIDISDPSNPDGVQKFRTDAEVFIWDPYDIYVNGDYAYVVNGDPDTLSIIDISNPLAPDGVGEIGISDLDISAMIDPKGIVVSGNYAYVVSSTGGSIAIIDVSDPANPDGITQITKNDDSDISTMDTPFSIYFSNNYIFVGSYTADSLSMIDVSSPTSPDGIRQITKDDDSDISHMDCLRNKSIFVSGDYVYTTGSVGNSLDIIHVTMPPELTLIPLVLDPTSDTTPFFTGTVTDTTGVVDSVQYQMDGTEGSWIECSAIDGVFDEAYEAFICEVTTPLSSGEHTIYVRATDSNLHTTPEGLEETDTFTVLAIDDEGWDDEDTDLTETGDGTEFVIVGLLIMVGVVVNRKSLMTKSK